jgi:hypothetical protein
MEFRDMNEISGFRIVYQEFRVSPDPLGVLGEKISLSAILGIPDGRSLPPSAVNAAFPPPS